MTGLEAVRRSFRGVLVLVWSVGSFRKFFKSLYILYRDHLAYSNQCNDY